MSCVNDVDDESNHDDCSTVASDGWVTPVRNRLAAGLNGLSITTALLEAGLTISDLDEGIAAESEHARKKVGQEDIEIEFEGSVDSGSIDAMRGDESATDNAANDAQSDDGDGSDDSSRCLFDDDLVFNGVHGKQEQSKCDQQGSSIPKASPLFSPGFAVHRRTVKLTQAEDPMVEEKERVKRVMVEQRLKERVQREEKVVVVSDGDTMLCPDSIDSSKGVGRMGNYVPDCREKRSNIHSEIAIDTLRHRLSNPDDGMSSRAYRTSTTGGSLSRSIRNMEIPRRASQNRIMTEYEMENDNRTRQYKPDEDQETSSRSLRPIQVVGRNSKQREAIKAEIQTELAMFQAAALLERETRRLSRIRAGEIDLDYECERPRDFPTTVRGVAAGFPSNRRTRSNSQQRYVRRASSYSGGSLLSDGYVESRTKSLRESEGNFPRQRDGASFVSNDNASRRSMMLEFANTRRRDFSQSARHLSADGSTAISRNGVHFQKRASLDDINSSDRRLLSRSLSNIEDHSTVFPERVRRVSGTNFHDEDKRTFYSDQMRGRKTDHISQPIVPNEYDRTPSTSSRRRNRLVGVMERASLQQDSSQRSQSLRSHQSQSHISHREDSLHSRSHRSMEESERNRSLRSNTLESQHSRSQRSHEESQRSRSHRSHEGQEMRTPSESEDPSRRRALKTPPSHARDRDREQLQDPPLYSHESARSLMDFRRTTGRSFSSRDLCGASKAGGSYLGHFDQGQVEPRPSHWAEYDSDNEYCDDNENNVTTASRPVTAASRGRSLPIPRHYEDEDPLESVDFDNPRSHSDHHPEGQRMDRSFRNPNRNPRERTSLGRSEEQPQNGPSHRYGQNHQYQAQNLYQPGQAEVEIGPGVWRKLRGADETWEAVMTGDYIPTTCLDCNLNLLVIANAEMVLCPSCRVVSPIMDDGSGFSITSGSASSSSPDSRHGIGLGFLVKDLMKWQDEMKRGIDPRFGGRIR